MKPVYITILNISIWVFFFKGIALIPVTWYTFATAYLHGQATPITGVATCAAGTFAFAMAGLTIFIKSRVEM